MNGKHKGTVLRGTLRGTGDGSPSHEGNSK